MGRESKPATHEQNLRPTHSQGEKLLGLTTAFHGLIRIDPDGQIILQYGNPALVGHLNLPTDCDPAQEHNLNISNYAFAEAVSVNLQKAVANPPEDGLISFTIDNQARSAEDFVAHGYTLEPTLDNQFILSGRTITGKEKLRQLHDYNETHDPLTKVFNRKGFERAQAMINSHERRSSKKIDSIAAIFIDYDKVKWINDNISYEAGDDQIRELTQMISDLFRIGDKDLATEVELCNDLIFRIHYTGDEFVILIFNPNSQTVEKLHHRLVNFRMTNDEKYPFSFGIARHDPGTTIGGQNVFERGSDDCFDFRSILDSAEGQMKLDKRRRKLGVDQTSNRTDFTGEGNIQQRMRRALGQDPPAE